MKQNVIAIDGPAGAGKSTVAKKVAATLGFLYIDTGAMYRAVTSRVLDHAIDPADAKKISVVAEQIVVRFSQDGGILRVWADGADVSEKIRTPQVTAAVASISQVPAVRHAMVRLQREMAAVGAVVLDGRDIGTVVAPNACTKIFLTASVAERARRRWLEMKAKGYDTDLTELQNEMTQRDKQDTERELAPLVQAADAVLVDTSGMTIEAVVEKIIAVYCVQCDNHV
ncbi:MAG TPA: (d)CMP kinase [Negativicutes bacterium]|nr:(d)CMP kinase [Negativicutes bacterium]